MTYQRRNGLPAKIWRTKTITDSRNNVQKYPDADGPHYVTVWQFPQRAGRAEVIGEQVINVTRIGCDPNLEGVELWSRVEMLGKVWDVITPPVYHHGSSKHVRHWSIDIKERP